MLVLCFLATIAHAGLEWNVEVLINEDDSVDEKIILNYTENIERSDYFVFAKISDVKVFADEKLINCKIDERELGTSITCDNLNASLIKYEFKAYDTVKVLDSLQIFKYKFLITRVTDRFSLIVKLPVGAALAEKSKLEYANLKPFEPDFGREGSDGRRILVSWIREKPSLGEALDVSVIYERIGYGHIILMATLMSAVIVIAVIFIFLIKKDFHSVLPVLTESERKIMEILLREKTIDQRKIVRETDFSKAKVSRIIKNLEERGLIERISKGRTNIIKLSLKKRKITK